uniref:Chloroplast light-harvesting complex I protein Lhca3 n=1 Tax=Euglena gracilis TaxID=3039 RepID=A4QPI1_EUGGR|nr:TPA_inf: chloroplast light-harvesting complex I protein precursor Lhca3 [Euglena gracilis]
MPIVLGVGALTTLITTLLFKSKNSIALAATAGQSTRGQSTRGQSTRGVPGSTRGQVSGSTRGQVSGSTRGQRSASTRGSASVEERLLWFPNVTPPAYLTGEFPGDRGFDPAGLSADPETFDRMRIAEIIHGRVAMLAVVGALVPDFLGKGNWFEAPAIAGIDIGDVQQFILGYGVFEFGRGLNKSSNPAAIYPGFDPLNLTSDYTKEAEIKNGRLALTAMLGFEVQRHVVGGSPLANLSDHLQQPLKFNIADSVMHPWPVAMFASTGSKDGLWFPNSKPPAHLISEYSTTATLVP